MDKIGCSLLRATTLSKYWKEVAKSKFDGVKYGDPENFTDQWYEEREGEIAKAEQEGEVRSKALNMPWREEKDLGQGVKLEIVLIPAGKFVMGSPKNEKGRENDEKQHEVTLTKPFYMGKYQITVEQWKAVMGSYEGSDEWNVSKFPKMYVSWNDCQEFINKLNAKTSGGYRLPTEAEWEYACRAGTTTAYSFGDEITPKDAKYADSGIFGPMAVGSYKPNAFGLYDMHGNAWELCEDWYGVYPVGVVTDPNGPATGKHRVLRGGSFDAFGSNARVMRRGVFVAVGSNARSSCRVRVLPSMSGAYYQGFRLAMTI